MYLSKLLKKEEPSKRFHRNITDLDFSFFVIAGVFTANRRVGLENRELGFKLQLFFHCR